MSTSPRISASDLNSGLSTLGKSSGSLTKTELKASARASALSAGLVVLEPSPLSSVGTPDFS